LESPLTHITQFGHRLAFGEPFLPVPVFLSAQSCCSYTAAM
jgi:hypothetical protein